ncbi:MAG TPA: hypothetical protein VF521_06145 [Pyrinomonadaceae bacterium]
MRVKLTACLGALLAAAGLLAPHGTTAARERRGGRARIIRFEPAVHAPELYADTLRLQFTLVNLPGADAPGSFWEGQYKVYFVPQGELHRLTKSDPTADDFQNKILLAEGGFRSKSLRGLQSRTFVRGPVPFKSKVPDHLRTRFANLVTSYSVKIYDARLESNVYRSSLFISHCFDDDVAYSPSGLFVPRATVYTSFFVAADGDLYTSQQKREGNSTDW